MDWAKRINNVLDYIEEHLDEELDYKTLAQLAYSSEYHFSRIFSSITGVPLSEYIRRRRLTRAAFELQNGSRVTDVALKYGYDSVDAFTRAFKLTHGITPSIAKKGGISLKAFPKLSLQLSIKGDTEMEYRIEQLDYELRIVGIKKPVQTSRAFKTIPTLWNTAKKDGLLQQLKDMAWENPKCTLESILGVCGKEAAILDDEFDYLMGVRYDSNPPNGMETMILPPTTWAVFPNIVDAWRRLYTEWVPTSGYELANLPCIECYYGPGHKPRHELWVPLSKN
ncbi:AraC family transcriptional regulator [Radiobacillus deserti]|uniref:AraC family transcriptional regulator n=1 Tax=Radiobacillus deserti TaxID=2594883 RepID=A0A516KLA4_9BACI|nr:AraC family transcriptional regulator [Radiobacillus deserti]QDP42172.1 AraC family transcriptional regulator [Radiobacillus deserti]